MISTIDSESTSRSSVNDLSSCTSSTATPATSLTISASCSRISSVVAMFILLGWVFCEAELVGYGRTTTWPAYTSPAPNPMMSAVCPEWASPLLSSSSIAMGMDEADVLPKYLMERATTTCSGSLRWRSIESVMRLFTWWGLNTSSCSGSMPVCLRMSRAASAMNVVAQRNTGLPSMYTVGMRPAGTASRKSSVWVMTSACVPSDPQTTGPTPGVSLPTTTAAPAPP